jgi:hypothetical protein
VADKAASVQNGLNLFLPTVDFRVFGFWFIYHLSRGGSGVTNSYDWLTLRGMTDLSKSRGLVNKALFTLFIDLASTMRAVPIILIFHMPNFRNFLNRFVVLWLWSHE